MAFKMNRPIIKGTAFHKNGVVSQARTGYHPQLMEASHALGKSTVPAIIDYSLGVPEIKTSDLKNKPKASEFFQNVKEKYTDLKDKIKDKIGDLRSSIKGDEEETTLEEGGGTYDEYVEKMQSERRDNYIISEDDWNVKTKDVQNAKIDYHNAVNKIFDKPKFRPLDVQLREGYLRKQDEKYENAGPSVRENMIAEGYIPKDQREGDGPFQKRNSKIFKFAVPGGKVQQNMIKNGYNPMKK